MLLPTTGKTENLASTTKNTRRANLRHKELDYITKPRYTTPIKIDVKSEVR